MPKKHAEKIAVLIHDMRNDAMAMSTLCYEFEHLFGKSHALQIKDMKAALKKMQDNFTDLIDLVFDDNGTIRLKSTDADES